MLNLTTADINAVERELCKRSLSDFLQLAWSHIDPVKYVHNWHIDALADHLEACAKGDIKRLLINIPPGTSKSTMAGVMFPAWLWGPFGWAGARIIGAAHEQGLAVRDNRKMRELVTSPWYQSHWPLKLMGDQNEKLYFENDSKGFRQASAVASMTGRRGDFVIWDDPHTPEKALSDVDRTKTIRIFRETLPTRLNDPERSVIIVVMQRLHEGDVSGEILASESDYEHLCIPMEYEPKLAKTTSIGWSDPRKAEGELLMPHRFTAEVVEAYKRDMGSYAYAGQMQQRPAPAGGGIFKDEWWQFHTHPPRIKWRTIYADTALKTKEQNDWSVFQCWGCSVDGQAVLLDQIRGKWEAPDLLVQARAFWNKHKQVVGQGTLRAMKPEDKASGTGLIQTLKREGIPVIPIQRTIDKLTRAYDASPFVESGHVSLPSEAPWLSDYLSEFSSFPNGQHDDQIDPTMDAIMDILHEGAVRPQIRAL